MEKKYSFKNASLRGRFLRYIVQDVTTFRLGHLPSAIVIAFFEFICINVNEGSGTLKQTK